MGMIPRAVIGKAGYTFESETEQNVADWERERSCLTADPDLFDYDANMSMHLAAKAICKECPVASECTRDRMLKNTDQDVVAGGVYGGMMWGFVAGVAPMDIAEWHKTHKVGGQFRNRDGVNKYDANWTQERECRNPLCNQQFTVNSRNHTKEFHSAKCRRRYRQIFGTVSAA